MRMVLRCQYAAGSITLHAEYIEDIIVSERCYVIQDHQVVLEDEQSIVTHDIGVLLATPDGGYRMPTPGEQEQDEAAQRRARIIQEEAH